MKKAPGRPRKMLKDAPSVPLTNSNLIIDNPLFITPSKKAVPLLQGEIIRLQRTSETVDSDSDSEIDIDGSEDEGECQRSIFKQNAPEKEERKPQLSLEDSSSNVVESEKRESETVEATAPFLPPELPGKCIQEDKSECESSETDSKYADTGSIDNEHPQPVFTFPTPLEERTVDLTVITDEEKTIHWDFFEGRPSKTPERYMKIRNSIVHEWRRVKPRYLTKTSVRPSLKNCGDVNCISRVHAYLELTGVINFACGKSFLY